MVIVMTVILLVIICCICAYLIYTLNVHKDSDNNANNKTDKTTEYRYIVKRGFRCLQFKDIEGNWRYIVNTKYEYHIDTYNTYKGFPTSISDDDYTIIYKVIKDVIKDSKPYFCTRFIRQYPHIETYFNENRRNHNAYVANVKKAKLLDGTVIPLS